jgi:hypothetical protein
VPSGVIAGLLGVGGGIWAVPAQTLMLGVRLRHAIATSTVMIIAVAIVTSAGMTWKLARLDGVQNLPAVAWLLTLGLAPGAIVGGWIGAGLAHKLPVRALRYIFLALLALTGIRLAVG